MARHIDSILVDLKEAADDLSHANFDGKFRTARKYLRFIRNYTDEAEQALYKEFGYEIPADRV